MMMTRWKLGLLFLAWLASPARQAEAGPIMVSGRVVLAGGQPAAGLYVATQWEQTRGEILPYDGVTTDAEGRFTIPVQLFPGRPRALMACDRDGKVGGVIV